MNHEHETFGESLAIATEAAGQLPADTTKRKLEEIIEIIIREHHCDWYTTIFLIVKYLWEQHAKNCTPTDDNIPGMDKFEYLKDRLDPDTKSLYKIKSLHELAEKSGFDERSFSFLIHMAIEHDIHLTGLESEVFQAFIARIDEEHICLLKASPEQRKKYRIAKAAWMDKKDLIGMRGLRNTNLKLVRENTKYRYMAIFGDLYLKLQSSRDQKKGLKNRIDIKEEHPEFTKEDIQARIEDAEKIMKQNREGLAVLVREARSRGVQEIQGKGFFMDIEYEHEYHLKAESVISESLIREAMLVRAKALFRLADDTAEKGFTEKQHTIRKSLLHQLLDIDVDELGADPALFSASHRAIHRILRIARRAEQLCAIEGVDLNPEYIIQGKTIEERLRCLKHETAILDEILYELEEEFRRLSGIQEKIDPKTGEIKIVKPDEYQEYELFQNALNNPDRHPELKRKYREQISDIRDDIARLKDRYERMFTGENSEDNHG